jgi:G3E family GTPase
MLQVAETFDMEVGGTSLKELSKLDTCVTVIDASNLELNLSSIKKVKVRFHIRILNGHIYLLARLFELGRS